jgi:hypothetical protein
MSFISGNSLYNMQEQLGNLGGEQLKERGNNEGA